MCLPQPYGLRSLRDRLRSDERMDDPALPAHEHDRALRALRTINRMSGVAEAMLRPLRLLAQRLERPNLRILDLATGGGDVPLRLLALGPGAGLRLRVDACDISTEAVERTRRRAVASGDQDRLRVWQSDTLRDPLPAGYDAVTCSLFVHHLSKDDGLALLRRMRAATDHLVLISDLDRSWLGWLLAAVAPRLISRSSVIHFDSVASVRQAFTRAEVRQMAEAAGLCGATVRWSWPSRWFLQWEKKP